MGTSLPASAMLLNQSTIAILCNRRTQQKQISMEMTRVCAKQFQSDPQIKKWVGAWIMNNRKLISLAALVLSGLIVRLFSKLFDLALKAVEYVD